MRWLLMAVVCLAIGCKTEVVDVNGMYIKSIERNTIHLEGEHSIELDNEVGSKVIYLVRHAEKDTLPKGNPILTPKGYERSFRLSEILKKTRLDAIYSTLYNRTMHTVDSLGSAKGIPTNIYQPKDLKQLGIDLTESKDLNKVIIAGHSNTTPAMANVLMDSMMIDAGFLESDYDNFLVVNLLSNGEKKLYQLRYK